MPNLLLSIVMATMATLSTTMLGLGQGSVVLPAMTLIIESAYQAYRKIQFPL